MFAPTQENMQYTARLNDAAYFLGVNLKIFVSFIAFFCFLPAMFNSIFIMMSYPSLEMWEKDFERLNKEKHYTDPFMNNHSHDISKADAFNNMFTINITTVIISAMVIHGCIKNRPNYLLPFFIFQFFDFFYKFSLLIDRIDVSRGIKQRIINERINMSSLPVFTLVFLLMYRLFLLIILWKCYKYLKLCRLGGEQFLTIYSVSSTTALPKNETQPPPNYETAIKSAPPPDYQTAVLLDMQAKNNQQLLNQKEQTNGIAPLKENEQTSQTVEVQIETNLNKPSTSQN